MNIIFDLGGVVFDWQPDKIIRNALQDPKKRAVVKREVFEHPDWIDLDRGTLDMDLAIVRAMQRTGLSMSDLSLLLHSVAPSLTPLPHSFELIQAMYASGQPLYVLSNMFHAGAEHLEREYDILNLFEGLVFSCRINLVKPEPAIYEHLLNTYQLDPAQTVFIDDTPSNLVAAEKFGITGVHFLNFGQCRRELESLGCL